MSDLKSKSTDELLELRNSLTNRVANLNSQQMAVKIIMNSVN